MSLTGTFVVGDSFPPVEPCENALESHVDQLSGFLICRRLQNRWRYTTWPAALSCAPRERGVEYDRAFEELAAELRKRELPDPSQVHLDWFHSSKTAARRVWPAILCRRGNEHLRRNLLRNQARGTRKPKRPGGAQAHAKANAKPGQIDFVPGKQFVGSRNGPRI